PCFLPHHPPPPPPGSVRAGPHPSPPVGSLRWAPGPGEFSGAGSALSRKALPQSGQPKGRSPVWKRWCWVTLELWAKRLPHCGQGKGFSPGRSPVCTRWCWMRVEPWEKALPHWEAERSPKRLPQAPQPYGVSPVWMRWWVASPRPHSAQAKGFSPVCTRRWVTRCELFPNTFPHTPHGWALGAAGGRWWLLRCCERAELRGKQRPQAPQR
uniref:Uncharacterized protein n=1 Tax=Terrapene triunguis TaxID=2587831 RepID=A0A674J4I4_9SAUR